MDARREVLDVLGRMAFLLELRGGAEDEARAFAGAAWALRSVEGDFAEAFRAGRVTDIRGVGPGVAGVIEVVLRGERPARLAELEAGVPAGLFELAELKGLGPKKVRALWQELGVTTIGELEYAIREHRLLELKGFGKKTQENLAQAIAERARFRSLVRLDQALGAARAIAARLRAELVGEARRALEEVPGIRLLVEDEAAARRELAHMGAEETDGALTLGGVRVELSASEPRAFGAALLFETGPADHWAALVARAASRGLALDRGGLSRGGEALPSDSEAAIADALEIHLDPPERRGAVLVQRGTLRPPLLERRHLLGAIHNHTRASDGTATLAEMRARAGSLGLEYLAITDHSQSAGYAGGLDAARLVAQRREIAELNRAAGCRLVAGVESDILVDGALDYPPDTLAGLEVVVASVHHRFGQGTAEMTERLVRALENPFTDVLGHPTGRLLLGARAPASFDAARVFAAAKAHGVAIELNASPHRLDLPPELLGAAKEVGVLISIGADAHSQDELESLDLGVLIARRAGLGPDDVLNARPWPELSAWLAARKARASALQGAPRGGAELTPSRGSP